MERKLCISWSVFDTVTTSSHSFGQTWCIIYLAIEGCMPEKGIRSSVDSLSRAFLASVPAASSPRNTDLSRNQHKNNFLLVYINFMQHILIEMTSKKVNSTRLTGCHSTFSYVCRGCPIGWSYLRMQWLSFQIKENGKNMFFFSQNIMYECNYQKRTRWSAVL